MHLRMTCLIVLGAAACGGTPAPRNPQPAAGPRDYELAMQVGRQDGHHSAQQTATTVNGGIQIAGDRASVTLQITTKRSSIRCPEGHDPKTSLQACSLDAQPDMVTEQTRTLTGSAATAADGITLTLRDDKTREPFTLSCREGIGDLECTGPGLASLLFVAAPPPVLQLKLILGPRRVTPHPPARCGVTARC